LGNRFPLSSLLLQCSCITAAHDHRDYHDQRGAANDNNQGEIAAEREKKGHKAEDGKKNGPQDELPSSVCVDLVPVLIRLEGLLDSYPVGPVHRDLPPDQGD